MNAQTIKRAVIATSFVGFLMTIGVQKAMAGPVHDLGHLADHEMSGEATQMVTVDGIEYQATESFIQKSEVSETEEGVKVIRTTVETIELKEVQ
ncbi:hypothetical protein JCM19236_3616 [Vibrio sp. JCM 19236]|nr:hypothetical protein JCM19236_3616 [Vibrio sp. JCM 19236]